MIYFLYFFFPLGTRNWRVPWTADRVFGVPWTANNKKYDVLIQNKGRSSYYKCIIRTKVHSKKIEKNSIKIRRSLFALRDIKKGEKFSRKNIGSFRPLIGLPADMFFKILGKTSKKKNQKTILPQTTKILGRCIIMGNVTSYMNRVWKKGSSNRAKKSVMRRLK